jgi:hypothetical protein
MGRVKQGMKGILGPLLVTAMGPLLSSLAAQQPDTTKSTQMLQAPGPHYRRSGLHSFLLGREYRSLWSTPVSVPVLDLGSFAGGLTPVSKGGGQQTRSLLLRAPDGREFFFRSIDKDPSATLPPELRRTVAGQVVRDQTSSAFPTAPLVVESLLDAAGILHGKSRFYVLPKDASLGEFQEFGGLMGFLQERIGGSDGPGAHWRGAAEIIDTDSLFARLARTGEDRVDTRAFLTARLFDVMIGDWDRHGGQWRWARFGTTVPRRWMPIPEDRDQAFVKYDGVLLSVGRQSAPQLTNFGPGYPYLAGATWNGRDLDRRLLTELDWPEWESAATRLQNSITDKAIDEAVHELPPEHYQLRGEMLASALRTRRDKLLQAARGYYELLAKQVEVHGSEGSDRATIDRKEDGSVELTILGTGADTALPYFRRHFDPKTTSEIRIFLSEGEDTAVVRGPSGGPLIRILGGAGADLLVDSTRGGKERFYDDAAAPKRTAGFAHSVDRRPYAVPASNSGELPPRDWGKRWTASTVAAIGPDIGLVIGGGRTLTVYGFRKLPFASRHRFRAGYATGPKTFRVDYKGEFRRENSPGYTEVLMHASGIELISFHGFGNEISAPGNNEFYRVTQNVYSLRPSLAFPVGAGGLLRVGPVVKYTATDDQPDRFLATLGNVYGDGDFGEVGAAAALRFDSRNREHGATKGMTFEVGGQVFPALWHVDSTFGVVHGEFTTYLTPPISLQPTLALRVGGRKLWGRYPFFEAAMIGGVSTVRLGRVNRYAGDASAYGTAELRIPVAKVMLVLPADLGIFGLADAGRVFLEGETSDKWHSAFGGGLWLSFLSRDNTIAAAVAAGDERTGFYMQAGFGF